MAVKGKYIYDWPRPMVTVDIVVFALSKNNAKVLLINRGKNPFKGQWAIPGGFIELNEELEDAAARELKEETGLCDIPIRQLHTFGTIGRDPRGRQITIVFWGITQKSQKLKAGDDAQNAKWFPIDRLPTPLAFDHDNVLNMAIRKLKETKAYRIIKTSRSIQNTN